QPLCDRKTSRAHRPRRTSALGRPRERAFVAILPGAAMERRVGREEGLNAIEVLGADGLAQLTRSLKQLYVILQLRPPAKAGVAGDLELGGGQGGDGAGAHEFLGLVAEVAEIWTIRKLHGEILSVCPVSA